MIYMRILLLPLPFFFLLNVYLTLGYFKVFFNFAENECLQDATKVSIEKVVRQATIASESFKKQQEHMISLEEREACLTNEVVELLK